MEENNDVILNYKTVCKSIKAPNNYLELKLGFLNIFNLEINNSFSFYYILDNKDNNKTYIEDDETFEEFIKNLKNDKNLTIFVNELNEGSESIILNNNDIQKEIESIKELLIKEEEVNKKLELDNSKYKEEMSQLEVEINKEEENQKEYNLNKGKYLEEIKQKEELINENKEKITELKSLLLDKQNEKESLEKQNNAIKNEIEENTDEINKLGNNQSEDNKSDKMENNLNGDSDIQNEINETEKETEKIKLKIEEEIENSKIIESKTNSLKDKIKKINKDKIHFKKIHPLKKNNLKNEHRYSKTNLIENRLNNSEVIHRLENSQIIYKTKILKRKNFVNEVSKSINESFDSYDSYNKKEKNINNISLEEENFKQIIKDKYKAKNSNRAQKVQDEIKQLLFKNKKIKENEEKLDIINNEIELSKSQIFNLKQTNDELKNEYDQISNEAIYDYGTLAKSQKINISKIFKQIDEKTKKVEESKTELKNIINEEKRYEIEIDKIKSENNTQKKKEEDLMKTKINCQILESRLKEDMNTTKENIQKKLKAEYDKKLKEKMEELSTNFSNKIKIVEQESKKIYLKKYEQSQINFNKKFSQISVMAKSKVNINNNNNNSIKSVCKTVHKGIKCQKCFQEPIVGYRYKCTVCNDYNLCDQCEEKNFLNKEHPHNFIKIRKERNEIEQNLISNINLSNNNFKNQNNMYPDFGSIGNNNNFNNNFNFIGNENNFNNFNNNNMNNLNNFGNNNNNFNNENNMNNRNNNNMFRSDNDNFNQNSNNNNYIQNNNNINSNANFNINRMNNNLKINSRQYSYRSLLENITGYSNLGDRSITFSITLENNGSQPWVNQKSFLIANPNNYSISCQNIELNPQLPSEQNTYKFTLSNLNVLNIGEYKVSYRFVVDGTSYGKDLDIIIYIVNRKNYHDEKIKEFRNEYGNQINNINNISNDVIGNILKKFDYDFDKSIKELFDYH